MSIRNVSVNIIAVGEMDVFEECCICVSSKAYVTLNCCSLKQCLDCAVKSCKTKKCPQCRRAIEYEHMTHLLCSRNEY